MEETAADLRRFSGVMEAANSLPLFRRCETDTSGGYLAHQAAKLAEEVADSNVRESHAKEVYSIHG